MNRVMWIWPAILFVLVGFLVAMPIQPLLADEGEWKLVWRDEFDKDGPPDPASWDYERGFVRNKELQWYQPENAICKNGLLVIEAQGTQAHPNHPAGGIRVEIPPGDRGDVRLSHHPAQARVHLWQVRDACPHRHPAGKLAGVLDPRRGRVSWPEGGEIDIMEYYRGTVLANVCHGLKWREKWLTTKKPLAELGGEKWTKLFHIWTMVWDKDHIELLLDGDRRAHFTVADDDEPGKDNAFRKPHYILLNQAIGGTNGGDPSRLEYPVRLEVDWVRVYQRAQADR